MWENLLWLLVATGAGAYFTSVFYNIAERIDSRLEKIHRTSDSVSRSIWQQCDAQERENKRKLDALFETVKRFDMNLATLASQVRRMQEPPPTVKAESVSEAAIRELTGGDK